MATGTIKKFNNRAGDGFIMVDGDNIQVYAHFSQLVERGGFRILEEGERVSFDIVDGPHGKTAENIYRIK